MIEFTPSTPSALEAIRSCRETMADAVFGAGTVLSKEDAKAAIDAGAEITVSPSVSRL